MNCRLLSAFAIAVAITLPHTHAEESAPPEGFRAIFDGKSLDGWYGWNPHSSAKLEGEKLAENLKT
ncbi:MAG TPA: lipase, partial [Bacteroidia bacterium]|nr:lipase [Bacteroidia bacterium]